MSIPIAPAPSTSARSAPTAAAPPIVRACLIARVQTDVGSASTPSRPSARGTAITCVASSATSSRAKPSSRVMPRSK